MSTNITVTLPEYVVDDILAICNFRKMEEWQIRALYDLREALEDIVTKRWRKVREVQIVLSKKARPHHNER